MEEERDGKGIDEEKGRVNGGEERRNAETVGSNRNRKMLIHRVVGPGEKVREGMEGDRPLKEFPLCLDHNRGIGKTRRRASVGRRLFPSSPSHHLCYSSALSFSLNLLLSLFLSLPCVLYKCQRTVCSPQTLYFW